MTEQHAEFDLAELAAEAAQRDAAARAEYLAAHGPTDHQEAFYGCHGSHGSRSVR
ncbi:hypothetical protein ACIG8S_23595 [[Kitasatospora] papulosa]|uniref:hypothetical protein n=1 Tax=Streptomyces TaxID=1883 RepID=UPI002E79BAA2|nr:hypothetical protein [Streptomyces sp. JV181]MEE1779446.1 hypothetical protein [Streptomyces sp. JV181]